MGRLLSRSRTATTVICLLLAAGCGHLREGAKPRHETVQLPGGVPLELVWVPAGTFWMGQQPNEQDAYPNKETPRHQVTLSNGFWLGKYEITKEQWKAVMGTTPWTGRRYSNEEPNTPAVRITWDDAEAFVSKLAGLTGKSFRLPTEAEWEYACRAGTTTRFYWGDDPTYSQIQRRAWWRGNALITEKRCARPVGAMPPNPWGLYDMSGNVSEWCQDWHGYYPPEAVTDPKGPPSAEHRVLRGGSWTCVGGQCRSSRRHHEVPSAALCDVGFRIAR